MSMFHLQRPGGTSLVIPLHGDLAEAQRVVICSPWIGERHLCATLVQLQADGIPIRIYTQLVESGSDPDCLQSLCDAAVDVQVWGTNLPQFFHPKVYLVQKDGAWIAWIGSANLTQRGMRRNVEAMVRLELTADTVQSWLNEIERFNPSCVPLTPAIVDRYRVAKNHLAAAEDLLDEASTEAGLQNIAPVKELPISAGDAPLLRWSWSEYAAAILDHPGRRQQAEGIIAAIRAIGTILRSQPPWSVAQLHEVFGLTDGFLGNLRQNYSNNEAHWLDLRTQIALHTINVAPAFWKGRPDDALDGFLALTDLPLIGCSTGSKFAAILAPAALCVVNKKSRDRAALLAGRSDLEQSTDRYSGYHALHRRIWETPWFLAPSPKKANERELWEHRVAVLDVFLAEFMEEWP